jgi:hypothetical protein
MIQNTRTDGRSTGAGESGERVLLEEADRVLRKEGECISISIAHRYRREQEEEDALIDFE